MKNQNHPAKKKVFTLLFFARILATVVAFLFSIAFVPKLIMEIINAFHGEPLIEGWEGLVMELTYIVFITGYIITWWRKCIGGLVLILAGFVQMGPFLIIDGNLGSLIFGIPILIGSLIFGIPILISGILFILFCKKD
jgi:hypothetical protein